MLRLAVLALACAACVRTSQDTDGRWSSLTSACVGVGATRALLDTGASINYQLAGGTVLYSAGVDIDQLSLATGASRTVLRADGVQLFGSVGDDLVYYESNGDPDARAPIDIIVDHGAHSTNRYQRISPRHGELVDGLLTTPNGVYWMMGAFPGTEDWRWDPATGTSARFEMDRTGQTRFDATSFLYVDSTNQLVVQSQTTGAVEIVRAFPPDPGGTVAVPPTPVGIDGDEVFFTYEEPLGTVRLVARGITDPEERVLATGTYLLGTLGRDHVYFTDDAARGDVFRVPRAGGEVETVFAGGPNTAAFALDTDACNVYWQELREDGGGLYARGIVD